MIYVTGDCHGDFARFTNRHRKVYGFTAGGIIIVCGDFGLLWADDKEFEYNLNWLSSLPFKILWVQGNHENYDMIEKYPVGQWNGGKVRHIAKGKIILLERGQVFDIEGKSFFTFGGARSHDIQGGILDRGSPSYDADRCRAIRSVLPYRIRGITWWDRELPDEPEMQEGRDNLEKVGYEVDYVISHCGSGAVQKKLSYLFGNVQGYEGDKLTKYFDELENKMVFRHWYMAHYHVDTDIDSLHTVLYKNIIQVGKF